ncbi:MAG TPA: zinc ABC transporter substrate-binding protein [Firmicutes bacterium]|nr:zinc ABC transporter substrate-binding protein [Bacillota bacterium]
MIAIVAASAVQQVVRMLAEAVGGKLVTLDPLGGAGLAGRSTYVELMRWNARRLAQAAARLQPVPPGK